MKTLKRNLIYFIVLLAVGTFIFIIGTIYQDSYFGGFGIGLFTASLTKIIQFISIYRNPEKLQKYKIQQNEERLVMLAQKSGHLTLKLTIIVELVIAIIFMVSNMKYAAVLCSCIAAVQTLVYLTIYFILSKKY